MTKSINNHPRNKIARKRQKKANLISDLLPQSAGVCLSCGTVAQTRRVEVQDLRRKVPVSSGMVNRKAGKILCPGAKRCLSAGLGKKTSDFQTPQIRARNFWHVTRQRAKTSEKGS